MRYILPASLTLLLMLALAVVTTGCRNEPSPEQLRADTLLSTAQSLLDRGSYQEAKRILLSVRELDDRLGRVARVAEEEKLLGDILASAAFFDSAFTCYASAGDRYKSLADRPSARRLTLTIAALHERMGDMRRGHTILEEALRLARVFADSEGVTEIQEAMLPSCRALERRQEETEILTSLSKSAAGSVARQAKIYFESGLSQFFLGLNDPAANDFIQAISSADRAHDSLLAGTAQMRLAMAYEAAGRLNETVQNYGEALKRCDKARGMRALRLELLIRVGTMYLRHRQYGEAARFYRSALIAAQGQGNKLAEGYLFVQLGHCALGGAPADATKNYALALDLFKAIPFPPGASYALLSLGMAAEGANQPAESLQHFKAAAELADAFFGIRPPDDLYLNCEQAYLGTRSSPAHDALLEQLLRLGRNDEAFWYLEQQKSRELFQKFADMEPRTTNEPLNALLTKVFEARARHVGTERQLASVASSFEREQELLPDVGKALESSAREFQDLLLQSGREGRTYEAALRTEGMGMAEVKAMLPPGSVLVEPVATRRSLYTFAITPSHTGVEVSAIDWDRLSALTREYRETLLRREEYSDSARSMVRPVEAKLQELTGRMYDLLVRPLEGVIGSSSHLYIVAPEELASVPIHALRRSSGSRGGYLIERTAVSYLPSARSLNGSALRSGPVREIVAMGYPGTTGWDVEYELRDIRAFYKDTRLFFGQQASLATLRRERADILHLAVDFEFNNRIPGNSYVVLSDSASPGISRNVPVGELFSLPPCATVVVSNLDPGRTIMYPMESYVLLATGTGSAIMNAYVPSRKTKKIFGEHFYTALLEGQTGPAAYRRALLEMIRSPEFASPGRWGVLYLWGN